jgi:NAD(P)-dependent dehydrogenase (short-subunit alcohol dehydrogenase family)
MPKKVALIVGGGGGFGGVIARALSQKNYSLSLADIDLERAKIASESLDGARAYQMDVRREEDVRTVTGEVLSREGQIDLLFAGHGLSSGGRIRVDEISYETWKAVLETNLNGTFLCMKYVIPAMKRQRSGCIISLTTNPKIRVGSSSYYSSKVGIEALTAIAAVELRDDKIGVYAVGPGGKTTTKFSENSLRLLNQKYNKMRESDSQESKLLKPEVIVPLCLHLAEDKTLELSGKTIQATNWNEQNGLGVDSWFV